LLDDFYLIRYYTDHAMVVRCKIEGGKVATVYEWFVMTEDVRKGLLINNQ